MRCASTTYELLAEAGVVKKKTRFNNVLSHFYPKPLRKKLLRMAFRNQWGFAYHDGRPTRKWEGDGNVWHLCRKSRHP